MHTLRVLVLTKLRIMAKIVFDTRRTALIRTFSMTVFIALLLFAAYLFFYGFIFKYVVSLEDVGYLLIERLISTGFLVFFYMLIISSFVTALATLFRSHETEYLFSTPVTANQVFLGKYIDILVYSSWSILLMALPILYSYAKIREFGLREYVLTGIMVLLPFVVFATTIGTLFALLAIFVSKRFSLKRLVIGAAIVFAVLIYAVMHFARPSAFVIPFTEDFRALNIFLNNFRLNSHPLTPNFWLIQSLRSLVYHEYGDFILYGSAIISSALFSFAFLHVIADRLFFPAWLTSNEESILSRGAAGGHLLGERFFGQAPRSQARALLNKDILLFIREPGQWAQLFLLLALLAVYFANLHFIPDDIEIEQWRTIIFLMNFSFCGFLLATVAIRFVFPSISLEGDCIWVLTSAPVSTRTLFREKFTASFTVFLAIGWCIILVSGYLLRLEAMYRLLTVSGIFLMSLSLSCIAVGFGAAYPDFGERNPNRIASSPGGILTVIVSLFYIGIMMTLLAIPSYLYTRFMVSGGTFPRTTILAAALATLLVNAVSTVVPLWMGAKALAEREY